VRRERLVDAGLIAIVVAVGAFVTAQSWHGWLDPIVDTGRDLYIPEQLRHGARLYRDIAYYYPPLTPLLLAIVTAVIGSSLDAYVAIGGSVALLTILALYALGRVCGGRAAGFGAALLFAACSVAGRNTWGTNYFFPYAHAATFAMLFFVGFLALLAAYLFVARRSWWLVAALACALAASWTKAEYAVFTTVVIAAAFLAHRIGLRWWIGYAVAALVSIAAVAAIFRGTGWFSGNVAPATMLRSPYLRTFYRNVAGLDQWPSLLARSAAAALILLVFTWSAAGMPSPGGGEVRWTPVRRSLQVVLCLVTGAALLPGDSFFRAWTVVQLALVPFALRRPREPLLLLLAASLSTTSRVFFNIAPVWYGFVFIVPLYALAAHLLARFRWALALIGAVAVLSIGQAHVAYARKTAAVTTARGTFYDALPGRAAAIADLQKLRVPSLVVIPEGLALNYLLAVPTPLRYYTFTPPEAADPESEARLLAEFDAKRPEWIAVVPRRMSEFGAEEFGVDYDRRLALWIRAHYAAAATIRRPGFSIVLLRRR
jgi:hypothetical protein